MTICIHNGIVLSGLTSNSQRSAVLIEDSKIKDTFSEERYAKMNFGPDIRQIDAKGYYSMPGFIDTHIHGFKGNGTDTCTTEGILQMSKDLAQYGVTAFNPTMYASSTDEMKIKLQAIVKAMGHEEGARIMGIHMEGPFISPQRLGVQRPETVRLPDIALFDELWEAAEGHIVNMTVAPELKGMRELALHCIEKGVILQAGHTNAEYENIVEGIQVGILHSTHFFNAMSQLHHRNPGTVGAILIHPEVSCEIIADGVHVHPDLFKLLGRDKNRAQVVLVTDALTPTELKSEHLYANGEEVVFKDGCFHRKADDVIAGSSLTMKKAIKNTVQFGFPLTDAIKFASVNPARIMKYTHKGILAPTYDSDILVMDKLFSIKLVMIEGNIVKNKLEDNNETDNKK